MAKPNYSFAKRQKELAKKKKKEEKRKRKLARKQGLDVDGVDAPPVEEGKDDGVDEER